jgi:hypothetical protein
MVAKQATVLASEVRLMKSKQMGRKYRISISLPYAYSRPEVTDWPFANPPAKWPVVYLLDANWYFGMVTDTIRSMAWCERTTDAIVVGIGYPEADDPQDAWREAVARRAIDFTPTRDEEYEKSNSELTKHPLMTGDAGGFHKFIKNELISLIEAEYQADPSRRVLAGHSLGGLFASFALFHEPGLFEAYVIGSPTLGYGDNFMFKREEAFFMKRRRLKARVYFSAGELEESADNPMLTNLLRFAAKLEKRNYKGLTITRNIFANLNHCEVISPCVHGGLMWALEK